MGKTLRELLNKYIPNDYDAAILDSGVVVRSFVDKEKRCLEVHAEFPMVIAKENLYELEESVRKAYDLHMCKIRPKYSSELFSFEYMKDILLEAEREGIVARGFFSGAFKSSEPEKAKEMASYIYKVSLLSQKKFSAEEMQSFMKDSFDILMKL